MNETLEKAYNLIKYCKSHNYFPLLIIFPPKNKIFDKKNLLIIFPRRVKNSCSVRGENNCEINGKYNSFLFIYYLYFLKI